MSNVIHSSTDFLGRYYTNSVVGSLLIDAMRDDSPKIVLDLGAGDGALTSAAAERWSKAKYFTVDIDKNAGSANFSETRGRSFTHFTGDALSLSIEKQLGLDLGSTDIALCNPPYIRPKWRKHFGDILEDAGLSNIVPKLADVSADVLFIAQNLRFLKKSGRLGLILPDGFIAGEKFSSIRNSLAVNHCIERVIELPRRIFSKTEAKAHIVILKKASTEASEIRVQRLESSGSLSQEIRIPRDQAKIRLDYSFLSGPSTKKNVCQLSIRDVALKIGRGSISSSQRIKSEYRVFHTSDMNSNSSFVKNEFLVPNDIAETISSPYAKRGDILIGRVGRNLVEKVCQVRRGNVVISDCVLMLSVDKKFRKAVYRFLKSSAGQHALFAASHGVGARFLTGDALLNILFEIYND